MIARLRLACAGLAPWQITAVICSAFLSIVLALLLLWLFRAYDHRHKH